MDLARRVTRVGAASVLCGLLALGGCGGESSESVATTTKGQWAHRAFEICRRLGHEQQRQQYAYERNHGMKVGNPGQRERERLNADYVMPFVVRKIKALRALPLPPGERANVEAILQAMEEGIRISRAHPEWLAAPSQAHPDPFTKASELAAEYGIWDCGQA
jgi:hypothetical protein